MPKKIAIAAVLCLWANPSLAEDLVFTLVNSSSHAVTGFFTSPTDVNDWEEDLFKGATLRSGSSTEITIADGRTQCDYDLKVVFSDGVELTDTTNLCDTEEYVVSDE